MVANNLRRTFAYTAGAVATATNAVLVWPLLARLASVADVGTLALRLAVAAVAAPAAVLGLHPILLRRLAGGTAWEKAEAYRAGRWIGRFWLVLGVASSPLLGTDASAISSILLLIAANAVALVGLAVLRGQDRPVSFWVASIGIQTFLLISVGVLLLAGLGIDQAIGIASGAALVGLVLLIEGGDRAGHHGVPVAKTIRTSSVLVPHLVFLAMYVHGGRVLLGWMSGSIVAAYYQFAAIGAGAALTLGSALNAHWATDTLRIKDGEQFHSHAANYARRLFVLSACTSVLITLASPLLVPIWVPADYPAESITLAIAILAPAAVMQAVGDFHATVAMRGEATGTLSLATSSGAMALVVIMVLHGRPGVVFTATAVLLGFTFRAALSVVTVRRLGAVPRFAPSAMVALAVASLATLSVVVMAV